MRIMQVTGFPNNGAGSGALITTQAEDFVKHNHEVCTILSENRTDFPRVEGVKYHLIPFTAQTENPETIDGQLSFNFPMFTTHTRSTATFWNLSIDEIKAIEQKYREAIAQEIEEFKPDVIHGQHNWIHNAVATEFDVPVVVTIHGTDLMGYERSLNALKEIREKINAGGLSKEELVELQKDAEKYFYFVEQAKKSANNSQRVIVISQDQQQKFTELFPEAADKVELVKNGYNPEKFHVMEHVDRDALFAGLTTDRTEDGKLPTDYDHMVLFVGKFADFKGIDVLLDAAQVYEQQGKEQGKNIMTVIVGTGALEAELKAQADRLNLQNTHFVGLQTPDVIRPLQNLSDLSVIPSRSEPFGLVVIEGTACGHPVIGTNSGGIPDIMNTTGKVIKPDYDSTIDGQNPNVVAPDAGTRGTYTTDLGLLVPVDDKEELAQGVMDILTEKKKFDGKKIAEYTMQTYSQEVINENLIALFQEVEDNYQRKNARGKKLTLERRPEGPSIDD